LAGRNDIPKQAPENPPQETVFVTLFQKMEVEKGTGEEEEEEDLNDLGDMMDLLQQDRIL